MSDKSYLTCVAEKLLLYIEVGKVIHEAHEENLWLFNKSLGVGFWYKEWEDINRNKPTALVDMRSDVPTDEKINSEIAELLLALAEDNDMTFDRDVVSYKDLLSDSTCSGFIIWVVTKDQWTGIETLSDLSMQFIREAYPSFIAPLYSEISSWEKHKLTEVLEYIESSVIKFGILMPGDLCQTFPSTEGKGLIYIVLQFRENVDSETRSAIKQGFTDRVRMLYQQLLFVDCAVIDYNHISILETDCSYLFLNWHYSSIPSFALERFD